MYNLFSHTFDRGFVGWKKAEEKQLSISNKMKKNMLIVS